MPDKDYTKIENARKAGRALTGKDFQNSIGGVSSSVKSALSGLLKEDRTRNMSAADLAADAGHRRGDGPGGHRHDSRQ